MVKKDQEKSTDIIPIVTDTKDIKSLICNFEKSSRSHRWTRFVAPKSYQELFTQMV